MLLHRSDLPSPNSASNVRTCTSAVTTKTMNSAVVAFKTMRKRAVDAEICTNEEADEILLEREEPISIYEEFIGIIRDWRAGKIDKERLNKAAQENSSDPIPSSVDELQKELQCKVCYERKVGVYFAPCRHMVTCYPCSTLVENCPKCRLQIDEKLLAQF